MDSRRIDYLATRHTTLLTFLQIGIEQILAEAMEAKADTAKLVAFIKGIESAIELHRAGKFHTVSPIFNMHVQQILSKLPDDFWVDKAFADPMDRLARCAVEGSA